MLKLLSCLLALLLAPLGSRASAQEIDLTGRYRCVQACLGDAPALITQAGRELNLVNEAGMPSRGWIDWPGHLFAHAFGQGATYSPNGGVIQFERGTVWQREVEPELVPAPRGRGKAARRGAPPPRVVGEEDVAPPAVAAAPPVPRAVAPPPRAVASPAPPPRGRAAANAYDGSWSVVISTQSGPCDAQYRFGVQILNGNVVHDGGGVAQVQGQVSPNGGIWVNVSSSGASASGEGRLAREHGGGNWRGQAGAGSCAGTWQAVRRG